MLPPGSSAMCILTSVVRPLKTFGKGCICFFVKEKSKFMRNPFRTLNRFELTLWISSLIVVTLSYLAAGNEGIISLIASLIGVTGLIFVAKGNVFGQILTIFFSILYAVVSYRFRYYGEMITYVGMSLPAAAIAVYTWIKNPYSGDKSEVKTAKLGKVKMTLVILLTAAVTWAFYYILGFLGTANLFISTVSVATSFSACVLLILRSPLYAVAYAVNDVVLITMWTLASIEDIRYLPMIFCFCMFLFNDLYGFFNWRRMSRRQSAKAPNAAL